MLGRFERKASGEATVKYGDGTMNIVKPGSFVRCAVTDEPIALDNLRYWSAELQEAYITPEAVMRRLAELAAARS